MTLEWTALPDGVVNLRTRERVTVDVVRDTINRTLLDRGYTMLRHGDTLSVHKLEDLERRLVPRVAPEDLEHRDPHEFVKVSFPLGQRLEAETVAKDLAFIRSPHGSLKALPHVNRIEAVDAVINLRQIRSLLAEERAASRETRRVRVFAIVHQNATDVEQMLRGLLGIRSKQQGSSRPVTQDEMLKLQAQMVLLRKRLSDQAPARTPPPKAPVRLGQDLQHIDPVLPPQVETNPAICARLDFLLLSTGWRVWLRTSGNRLCYLGLCGLLTTLYAIASRGLILERSGFAGRWPSAQDRQSK